MFRSIGFRFRIGKAIAIPSCTLILAAAYAVISINNPGNSEAYLGVGRARRTLRPRTISIPLSTSSRCLPESRPTRSVRSVRSRAMICETLATESFGRPVSRARKSTLPGASAHRSVLVSGTHTTVAMRLRLRGSPWTTTTGRRKPGPDPVGSGKSAQHTSPCAITIRCVLTPGALWQPVPDPGGYRDRHTRHSSPR